MCLRLQAIHIPNCMIGTVVIERIHCAFRRAPAGGATARLGSSVNFEHSQPCEAGRTPKFNYIQIVRPDLSAVVTAGPPQLNVWVNLARLARVTVGRTSQGCQGHRNTCDDLCQWQNIYRDSVF